MMKKRLCLAIFAMLSCSGILYATAPAGGVFSVSATKTVRFGNANETSAYTNNLMQWNDAVAKETAGWQLLNHDEWDYLLDRRNIEGKLLHAGAQVDGHYGLILLPDGWVAPSGVTILQNGSSDAYANNIYSAAEWSDLAATGAVFLPCGGYSTDGEIVPDADDHGVYWAQDGSGENAYRLQFDADGTLTPIIEMNQTMFYSVLLTKEVPSLSELDEKDAFDTKIAALRSQTEFYLHRTLYKDGYFNTLCLPFTIADIESSPLAGAEVFAFAGASVEEDVLRLDIRQVNVIEKGVPYLIRWSSGDDIYTPMLISLASTADWDDNDQAGEDPGSDEVKYHGFYYKTHLEDETLVDDTDWEHPIVIAHYNFFLDANDELKWPTDGANPYAKMKSFRAHFYIVTGTDPTGKPSYAPVRPGMPAVLREVESTTGIERVQSSDGSIQKWLRADQVIIVINGEAYSIRGQRL